MSATDVDAGSGATPAVDLTPLSPWFYRRANKGLQKESYPEPHCRLVAFSSTLWRPRSTSPHPLPPTAGKGRDSRDLAWGGMLARAVPFNEPVPGVRLGPGGQASRS